LKIAEKRPVVSVEKLTFASIDEKFIRKHKIDQRSISYLYHDLINSAAAWNDNKKGIVNNVQYFVDFIISKYAIVINVFYETFQIWSKIKLEQNPQNHGMKGKQ